MRLALLAMIAVTLSPQFSFSATNELSEVPALRPPIRLDELQVWRDGGSLGFNLSDSDQHRVAFCVDYRIGSPTKGYFFLGATHATQSGAQKLDLGCDTEKKLISYLEAWLAANFKRDQLTAISSTKDVGALTQDEFKAWHVLRLVENRAKAVEAIKAQAHQSAPANGASPRR